MGNSIEGHSEATQNAQPQDHESDDRRGGFFRRIMGVLLPHEENAANATPSDGTEQAEGPGLGNLHRLQVADVSVPKADIVAVPSDITKDKLVEVFRDSGLTRLPVYKGTLDTPIGMAHLKDFALKHGFNGGGGRFSLKKMLRPLLFVPPSMAIGVLLHKMQNERQHMALVIDEYGGVDGLVTIEDLVEQVVGEIEDEHDIDEGRYWILKAPGCYLALAKTPLEAFETEIGRSLTDHDGVDGEEIDTLGGLVFMLSGRVPVRGEVIEHPNGTEIEVIEADTRRIKRLRVKLPDTTAAED